MARTGWSAANFLRSATAPVTAAPLTIAVWFNIDSAAATRELVGLFNSASAAVRNCFDITLVTARNLTARTGAAAANVSVTTSTAYTLGTWGHACYVTSSASSRAIYLNGGGKGTDVSSATPSGVNRWSVGLQDNTAANNPLTTASLMAEAAVWSAALGDDEVAMLAAGVPAFMVRPSALVAYAPILGAYSPEIELVGRNELVIQGTLTAGAHPPIFGYPRSSRGSFHSLPSTSGTLSQTLANATLSSAATLQIVGALAQTLANATLSSAAALQIKAALARTLADATLSAAAQLQIQATLAKTLDDATLVSIFELGRAGVLNVTLQDAILIATGNDGWTRQSGGTTTWTSGSSASTTWTPVGGGSTVWTPR